MILREFLGMAAANLWRMKLRSALTIFGVVIGIGAMAAMLSFAFGIQKNVAERFRALDLFHTLQVMPPPADTRPASAAVDSTAADSTAILNDEMLARIESIDGVVLVYPQESFDAQLEWRDRSRFITAQALPAAFAEKHGAGGLLTGRFYNADTLRETVLSRRLVQKLEADPDSILGDTLRLQVTGKRDLARRFAGVMLKQYNVSNEIIASILKLADWLLGGLGQTEVSLEVVGVAELEGGWGLRFHDLLVPSGIAAGLDHISFSNPVELMSRLSSGDTGGYPLAIVTLQENVDHQLVRDAIEDLGLRTISFVDRFEEMRQEFVVFDLMMSVLGLIALAVAALGISNTMIMSIMERTREIGILRSLGAADGQIRGLFLLESALIGFLGGVGGVVLGWVVSRIGSFVIIQIMKSEGVPQVDLFHLPILVALGAIAFGMLVSLAAGLYPAARAVRIDPVRALRHD
ncbi:MAG: FtsX-like permease family protein [Candidatus Eisenbacteria bacterium]|nr:FtsX-like permease family protein [Candidatus Eisenbacteria bacterium]